MHHLTFEHLEGILLSPPRDIRPIAFVIQPAYEVGSESSLGGNLFLKSLKMTTPSLPIRKVHILYDCGMGVEDIFDQLDGLHTRGTIADCLVAYEASEDTSNYEDEDQ